MDKYFQLSVILVRSLQFSHRFLGILNILYIYALTPTNTIAVAVTNNIKVESSVSRWPDSKGESTLIETR